MTGRPVYQITAAPPRPRARPRWGRLRGLAAVATLLLTAADDLASALTGWPPAARIWRQLAAPITITYRHAATAPPAALAQITHDTERDNTNG